MRIYLAGPISGCTFGECTDWREYVTSILEPAGIQCLSPLRGKDYLRHEKVIDGSYPQKVLSCSRGIMTRDFFDCTHANAVMVNLLGATSRISVGTVMEIAWAFQARIPLILCMEDAKTVQEGNAVETVMNPHDHPMVQEATGFRVNNLEDACHVARMVLWPGAIDRAAAEYDRNEREREKLREAGLA